MANKNDAQNIEPTDNKPLNKKLIDLQKDRNKVPVNF